MTTQHDAAKLYNDLQDAAADRGPNVAGMIDYGPAAEAFQRAVDADWNRRHPPASERAIAAGQAQLNDEDRRRMMVVVYALGTVGLGCLALLAFVLPWAALIQWAVTGDTGRYLLTLLAFGAVIVGGLLWRGARRRK